MKVPVVSRLLLGLVSEPETLSTDPGEKSTIAQHQGAKFSCQACLAGKLDSLPYLLCMEQSVQSVQSRRL